MRTRTNTSVNPSYGHMLLASMFMIFLLKGLGLTAGNAAQASPTGTSIPAICGPRETSIYAGIGVGPIRLGMAPREEADRLGATIIGTFYPNAVAVFTYAFRELEAPPEPWPSLLAEDNKILAIHLSWDQALSDLCATAAGIRLGSSQDVVRQVYGVPPSTLTAGLPLNTGIYQTVDWVYNARGIAFSFQPAAAMRARWIPPAVTGITIFPPERFCDVLAVYPPLLHGALSCAMFSPTP